MEYIQKCVGQIEMSQYAMLDTETSFVFTTLFWDDLIPLAFATFIALTNEKLVTWCISPVNHTGLYQS